jgi:potassium-transporting ATPase KdpC subunit
MNAKSLPPDPIPKAVRLEAPTGPAEPRAPLPKAYPESVGTHLRAAAVLLVLTILVGGIGYPLAVTGVAQLIDPGAANGSLIKSPNGTVIGSSLVAPPLLLPWGFWPRPSETGYNLYNGSDSPPGPTDPELVNETLQYLAQYGNGTNNATIPLWLLTPSGSGIDPDITPDSAYAQVPRVQAGIEAAFHVAMSNASLDALIASQTQGPPLGVPGPSYVDVTTLNLDLWELAQG